MTQSNSKSFSHPLAGETSGRRSSIRCIVWLLAAALVLGGAWTTPANAAPADGDDPTGLFPDWSKNRYGQDGLSGLSQAEPAKLEARYTSLDGQPEFVVVAVDVKLNSPWHLYSLTQPKGGPLPTKIRLLGDETLEVVGSWQSDSPPKKSVSPEFQGITIEEHDGEVTFYALARIRSEGVSADSVGEIKIEINGLTCVSGGACQPLDETLTANFAGETPAKLAASALVQSSGAGTADGPVSSASAVAAVTEPDVSDVPVFRDDDYAISWIAYVATPALSPGQQGKLTFTAVPSDRYHIYPAVTGDADMATNFAIEDKAGLRIGAPATNAKIKTETPIPGLVNRYHPGNVTWTLPIEIPADAKPGKKTIRGAIAYQACTAESCLMPMAMRFEAVIEVLPSVAPEKSGDAIVPMTLVSAKTKDVKKLAADATWVDKIGPAKPASDTDSETSALGSPATDSPESEELSGLTATEFETDAETATGFPLLLAFAFIGGFILNFMPCVLPVVGLKVMSFVQQAGSDRKRAFLLNFAYSAGIMAIFAGLAVAMVVFSMAWGEMFTYFSVRVGLTILMFAMALSYFGFWELPAPGMASSKGAQDLQQKEGYTGAFFKGMFATILSTPCSGPFLGGIFALIGGKLAPMQSTIIVLVIGVGMAIPYVIMGIWPRLMSWLPKPGPWMETFKEFLAFLFLGTVAFFFYTFNDEDKLWVFVSLIGVWFGCWIIGKVPSWQTMQRRMLAWTSGVGVAVAISLLAFQYLGPVSAEDKAKAELEGIAWVDYDEDRLAELQAEGKTVLVDFSAKWCMSCLANLSLAIDTRPTADLVRELDAVAMYADWTDYNPEIKAKLAELDSKSIPLLAIYPGKNPTRPIVLRDVVSQQNVLDALRQAGPSQNATSLADRESTGEKVTR